MSMWEALEGCRLKIVASADHLHRLDEAVERFFEGEWEVAPITGRANSQRTKYVFRVENVMPYPAREWGIIVGDSVHCLRSALDQLTWTFAKEPSSRTAFPICTDKRDWVTRAPAQYWSVTDGLARLFDRVQPYHRGDPFSHPLAILRTLSNLDKHRGIPTITLVPDDSEADVLDTRGLASWKEVTFHAGAAYEKNAVVAECKIVPDDSGLEPEMNVRLTSTFDVGFGEIPRAQAIRHRPVGDVIQEIGMFISTDIFDIVKEAWNASVRASTEKG